MCIGTPVQVVQRGEAVALCRGRNGDEQVNMLLVGQQPEGTWVLSYLGWAREVLDADQARDINLALDGMQQIMDGAESIDMAHHFPGLGQEAAEAR
ncbi:MAG TPA: HypC/HybG/HupF family hydrogenase formation chaperone [Burkholderiaceae bacterium]|nr:HypC/HybG/HupF family hydrogenase formation chaperone [Burkholderiaceae bacterium]